MDWWLRVKRFRANEIQEFAFDLRTASGKHSTAIVGPQDAQQLHTQDWSKLRLVQVISAQVGQVTHI